MRLVSDERSGRLRTQIANGLLSLLLLLLLPVPSTVEWQAGDEAEAVAVAEDESRCLDDRWLPVLRVLLLLALVVEIQPGDREDPCDERELED